MSELYINQFARLCYFGLIQTHSDKNLFQLSNLDNETLDFEKKIKLNNFWMMCYYKHFKENVSCVVSIRDWESVLTGCGKKLLFFKRCRNIIISDVVLLDFIQNHWKATKIDKN